MFALHDEALLVDRGPALLLQQRAYEFVFQLRFLALGQARRVEVLGQSVGQAVGNGLFGLLTALLVHKALVQQCVDAPGVGEQVLGHTGAAMQGLQACQGLITGTPAARKGAVSRVATVRPLARATAAM